MHVPPVSCELVPHVPAVGSTQHAVGPGKPGIGDAGAVHVFEPQGTGAAVAAPAAPPPLVPAVPVVVVPAAPGTPPPPTAGAPALPAAPEAPAAPPLPPLLFESLPQATTPDAPSNPIASHPSWRFILLTSLLFATRSGNPRTVSDLRSRAHSMPRASADEKGRFMTSDGQAAPGYPWRAHAFEQSTIFARQRTRDALAQCVSRS
jgi:hypothetical protein